MRWRGSPDPPAAKPSSTRSKTRHAERGQRSSHGLHRSLGLARQGPVSTPVSMSAAVVEFRTFLLKVPAIFVLRAKGLEEVEERDGGGGGKSFAGRRATRYGNWLAGRAGGMGGGRELASSARAEAVSEAAAERSALRWLRCSALALAPCVYELSPHRGSEPIYVARCTCCVQRARCVCDRALHIAHALRCLRRPHAVLTS